MATSTQIAICRHGSVTSGSVPDSTTIAIDRLFDFVDSGVEKLDRVLNRGKATGELHRARRASRGKRAAAIDTSPVEPVKSNSTALALKPHFYIVESVGPSGEINFVVTDGRDARTTCSTREFAEKVLRALELA